MYSIHLVTVLMTTGEVARDYEAKKLRVFQTMLQPDQPKEHNWQLSRYDLRHTFNFYW